jgi:adenylyl-sulfate kinase
LANLTQENVVWHHPLIEREQREGANGHKAAVVWFTGLSASGKSTTAHAVERELFAQGYQAYTLDGDNVRHGLSADLGFSPADRAEHLRRIGELTKLMYGAGMIVLCAFISPTRESRQKVRKLLPAGAFFEVFCKCPLEICEQRDPKGFYARALKGEIKNYTGVSAAYEEPLAPELVLDTAANPPDACAASVRKLLQNGKIIPPAEEARKGGVQRAKAK